MAKNGVGFISTLTREIEEKVQISVGESRTEAPHRAAARFIVIWVIRQSQGCISVRARARLDSPARASRATQIL